MNLEQSDVNPPATSGTQPLLVVLSAPSGGGKTTLCEQLLAVRPEMTRAVTCTTRTPRAGERDGIHYHFLDAATFSRRVEAGEFLEWANVYGNKYGTLKSEVVAKLRQGRDVLLSVDVQGAASIRRLSASDAEVGKSLITVFLTPPSLDILEDRLKQRGSDSADTIQRRLKEARQEIAQWREFDYVIISSSKAEDLRRMLAIIEAEKMRTERIPQSKNVINC